MDISNYIDMFIEESKEHLQAINDYLLLLEQDVSNVGIVQHIFRSAHTLKGMSATMGFEDMASLTHEMENVLDEVRNGRLLLTSSMMDVIFRAVDALENMVYSIADGGNGKLDISAILTALHQNMQAEELTTEQPSPDSSLQTHELQVIHQAIHENLNVFQVKVTLRRDCQLKYVRVFMVVQALESVGQIIKTKPSMELLEADQFDQEFEMYLITGKDENEIQHLIFSISEIESVEVEKVQETFSLENRSVPPETLDDFDSYESTVFEQALDQGFTVWKIQPMLREDCVLKAARAFIIFDQLEAHGEILKSNPSVEEIEDEKFGQTFDVYLITKTPKEKLEHDILSISEVESVEMKSVSTKNIGSQSEEKQKQQGKADPKMVSEKELSPKRSQSNKTIRVDSERLDVLLNLFSEFIIDRGRLQLLAEKMQNHSLVETVEHLSRISGDLQNVILKLRMVAVDQVFNRFPRMVRDLARDLNKKVTFVMEGTDTELDRTVIDEVGDPLVHLLRNCMDHGLESPDERIRVGKPEEGTIHLKANHSGNHVMIEVQDDGRGINRDKVLKKALEKGIISDSQVGTLADQQVYQLLFSSGFSTADAISDISGRGVGLDVVKSKIETLGGSVRVESVPNKGTTFFIQLPLTLSIISSLLIRVGRETYAIPLHSVIESNIIQPEEILRAHHQEVIDFRGRIIPLISLKKLFKIPSETDQDCKELPVVIIRKGEKAAAFIVDSFLGKQDIVLKSLGNYLGTVWGIGGATILGNGQVALIIDCHAFFK